MRSLNTQSRLRLDRRFAAFSADEMAVRPPKGWIRAIRDSLGMSATELGQRMGVSQQSVAGIERSEAEFSIKLDTLQRVAAAMQCRLVYALVPLTSLEDVVQSQAIERSREILSSVAHSSRLEDQEVGDVERDDQLRELADALVDTRRLWGKGESTVG